MSKSKVLSSVFMSGVVILIMALFIPIAAIAQVLDLNETVILTTGDIDIRGVAKVKNGHVCSQGGTIDLGREGTVEINEGGSTGPGVWYTNAEDTSQNIMCRKNADLTKTAGVVVRESGCKIGEEKPLPPFTCPTFSDDFPTFTGDENAELECFEGCTDPTKCVDRMVPGQYSNVKVTGNCVFEVDGNPDDINGQVFEFNMISLEVKKNGRVEFRPALDPGVRFELNIRDYFSLTKRERFNTEEVFSVFVNVQGQDGPGNPFCMGAAAALCLNGDHGNVFVCRLYAPNGTVAIAGATRLGGQTVAQNFEHVARGRQGRPIDISLPAVPGAEFDRRCGGVPPEPRDCPCNFDILDIVDKIDPVTGDPVFYLDPVTGDPILDPNTQQPIQVREVTIQGHNLVDEDKNIPPGNIGITTVDFVIIIPEGDPPGSTPVPVGNPRAAATCEVRNSDLSINRNDACVLDNGVCKFNERANPVVFPEFTETITFDLPLNCLEGNYFVGVVNHVAPTDSGPFCIDNLSRIVNGTPE